MECGIEKKIKGKNVYYTIAWSHLRLAEKYSIARGVPAMGGIVEIYYMDEQKKLNLICVLRSWYGGIRSLLRESTDPLLEKDDKRREIITKYEKKLYYRYALLESQDDMQDLVFFLASVANMDMTDCLDSGRYEKIFVKEVDADKLVTI